MGWNNFKLCFARILIVIPAAYVAKSTANLIAFEFCSIKLSIHKSCQLNLLRKLILKCLEGVVRETLQRESFLLLSDSKITERLRLKMGKVGMRLKQSVEWKS